ncbi:hypothetical protein D3C81_1358670 [compost metagenome]
MLGVVEAARARVVDRKSDQITTLETLQHRIGNAAIQRAAHMRHRVEHIRQAQRPGQRKRVVQGTGIHAGDIDGAEARHVDGLGFAAELTGVVLAQAQASAGLLLQLLADPLHGGDRRVVGHMHITCGQQLTAARRTFATCRTGRQHRRGERTQAGSEKTSSSNHCALPRVMDVAAALPGGHGLAGNVAATGKTDQCLLAHLDVVDAGGIAGGDQIALLQRATALGRA